MDDELPLDVEPTLVACPECAGEVEVTRQPWAQQITCPHCQGSFVVAAIDGSIELSEEQREEHRTEDAQRELDNVRMRNLATGRMAAYRARSYAIIGAVACAVGAVQLVLMALDRSNGITWRVAYSFLIVLAVWGLIFCFRRARDFHRETKLTLLKEPDHPPDFSTLSDGSQRWDDFRKIR